MAKINWGMNDTVMPTDMNQMGEEINTAIEVANSAAEAVEIAGGMAAAATDELSDATSAAAANALAKRDANGRMKAAAPAAADDVARKAEVDAIAETVNGIADVMLSISMGGIV